MARRIKNKTHDPELIVEEAKAPHVRETPRVGEHYTGIYQAGRRGGFVVLEAPGYDDVFIRDEDQGSALHGDEVRVHIDKLRPGRLAEGTIERVLRHANKHIVGQLTRSGRISIVRPKNPKIDRLIEIHRVFPPEEVPDGAWVIAEIKSFSKSPRQPLIGSLSEVLGLEKDRRIPILLLIREGGIRPEFPREVEAEADEIRKRAISEAEIARRRDFRSERVFTIDPATAKDFDDAISLVEKKAHGWRISVHIADVSHYMPPGSKTDLEAYDRATSIYPVDRVIPMLPEVLSNDLCSLRPGAEKLTMAAIFDVDFNGEVNNVELAETVIRSVRRFNYEEVQGLMDEADGVEGSPHPKPDVDPELLSDLMELRQAASALLGARMKRGSLDLDLPETTVIFDDEGVVSDLRRKERLESHRLIEDFMIAANEAVARELTKHNMPLLYRVHEPPEEGKLAALTPALARLGLRVPKTHVPSQEELSDLLAQARQHPAGTIVQRWVLRAMMRAKYAPENLGHFGLASTNYCHFTSPIRRYPDVIVHRAVKMLLKSKDAQGEPLVAEEKLAEMGRHTSSREERAQRIEWDAEKILALEFMKRHMGDVFEGFISGAMRNGFFVELIEYPAEGFVPIRSLNDDYYDLDKEGAAFYGRRTGKSYAVGDRVTVQIERIDVLEGEMDFALIRKAGVSKEDKKKAKAAKRETKRATRRSGRRPGRKW